ncbi:MAG: DUF5668 domain-containing protein [Bacteroidetes bacterium]|nr:DUF5668 domain-containing protein [Bacteroidota bacterium]
MKYRTLFWGILLIAIGLLFVLNNLGILSFSWYGIWRLWPLILIFWGISILPIRDGIKFIVLISVIALTFLSINRLPETSPWYFRFHHHNGDNFNFWDDDENGAKTSNNKDQNFTVPFDSVATKGILNLEAAAGNFKVSGIAKDFLDFSKTGEVGNYEMTTNDITNGKNITLKMEEGNVHGSFRKNKVEIKLNPKPSWNMKLEIGAASLDLDLTEYKIDTVEVDAGASSMNIKLGDKNPRTDMKFDAGASSINIEVPENSGCQITSESFLVSKNFKGFDKKGDHIYETPNFSSAKNKIYIIVETAVSSINVKRY